jgi:hypothetical protein
MRVAVSVQLHLDRIADLGALELLVEELSFGPGVARETLVTSTGHEGGRYANATVRVDDADELWRWLESRLLALGLLRGAIVVCQGRSGWDDDRTLHNFTEDDEA